MAQKDRQSYLNFGTWQFPYVMPLPDSDIDERDRALIWGSIYSSLEAVPNITIGDASGNSFEIPPPDYGYEVIIHMNKKVSERVRGFSIYDYGVSYDWRELKVTWTVNATDANNLLTTFTDTNKSRAKSISLSLPQGSGFFPFGPDLGDCANFVTPFKLRLIDLTKSSGSTGNEPWKYFKIIGRFVMEQFPPYTIPAQNCDEGNLQIGTISGLRFPQNFTSNEFDLFVKDSVTLGGNAYMTDYGSPYASLHENDKYVSTFNMVLNHKNAANLINHLTQTVRGNDVDLTSPANSYVFGRLKGDTDTYTCRWLDKELRIIHSQYDRFEFNLRFNYKTE